MTKTLAYFLFLLMSTRLFAFEVNFEEDRSLPLVYLNVALKAGSVDDPEKQSGITNFLGQMLLRGTRSQTKEQMDLALDQMGAELNIETRAEAVVLRGAVLAHELPDFLKLLTEILTEPSFSEHEIKKLKAVVISQILDELGSDRTLSMRRATRHLFQKHPYGKPVLGIATDIEKLNRSQIQAHFDRLIRDKKLLILGAGDTKAETIQTWAHSLAQMRQGGSDSAAVSPPEDFSKRKLIIIDKPDRTQTQIYGGQVGIKLTNPDFFPLYIANYAFGGGSFLARMMVEIRVKRGWSYGAGSFFRHGRQPRSWQFHLFPAAKDTAQALAYSINMVSELKEKGITSSEFEQAKQSLMNNSGFMFNTPQKRVENKLLEKTLELPTGFMSRYQEKLSTVTLAQANHAIGQFLKPEHLSVTVLGTAKDLREPLAKAAGVPLTEVEVIPYTQEF